MNTILGVKKQMIQVFDDAGMVVPCTIVDFSNLHFLGKKENSKDGYESLVLGLDYKKNPTKAESKQFGLKKTSKHIKEIGFEPTNLEKGSEVEISLQENDMVDVTGTSKGKGFQGVMKLHGMSGGPKTHGQSTKPRSIGSIAPGQTFAHVHKGRRMARKMGNETTTVKNLKIVKIDKENKVILVRGALPGMKNSLVIIKKVVRK